MAPPFHRCSAAGQDNKQSMSQSPGVSDAMAQALSSAVPDTWGRGLPKAGFLGQRNKRGRRDEFSWHPQRAGGKPRTPEHTWRGPGAHRLARAKWPSKDQAIDSGDRGVQPLCSGPSSNPPSACIPRRL